MVPNVNQANATRHADSLARLVAAACTVLIGALALIAISRRNIQVTSNIISLSSYQNHQGLVQSPSSRYNGKVHLRNVRRTIKGASDQVHTQLRRVDIQEESVTMPEHKRLLDSFTCRVYGARVAIIGGARSSASSVLRGQLIAEAMAALTSQRAWEIYDIRDVDVLKNIVYNPVALDVCVLVKKIMPLIVAWCRDRGARRVFLDLVDNGPAVNAILQCAVNPTARAALRAPDPSQLSGCNDSIVARTFQKILMHDVLLTQTQHLARVVNDAKLPVKSNAHDMTRNITSHRIRGAVLHHQHTNPSPVRIPREGIGEHGIRDLVILSGDTHNMPTHNALLDIAQTLCSSQLQLRGVHAVCQNTDDARGRAHGHFYSSRVSYTCSDVAGYAHGGDSIIPRVVHFSGLDRYSQASYFEDPALWPADIALLWPNEYPSQWTTIAQRPPTRMLFWMSLGVPVIAFPYKSYTEILESADDYSCVPAAAASKSRAQRVKQSTQRLQSLPSLTARTPDEINAVMRCLSEGRADGGLSELRRLAKAGIQAANAHTTRATATKLARIICSSLKG
mmetsp:Transcript_4421/g.12835  ORF Transcript_4421/g.12835 Transcript_4421/m.12835 type:complete len:564 (-) Transcript_4421:788-2479(-)